MTEQHPMREARRRLPSLQTILSTFEVDIAAGKLFWRPRTEAQMPELRARNSWNARYAGKEAGGVTGRYAAVSIDGFAYLVHRLIYKVATGLDPQTLDHIDGNSHNNSFANLREVTQQENTMNSSIPSTNTSGCIGVSRVKATGKWRAFIKVDQRQITLGQYIDYADAVRARKRAERQYGFHPNHGRFALEASNG